MPSLQPVFGLLWCKQGLKYIQIPKPEHQSLISINTLATKRHSSIGTVATLTKEPNQSKLPRHSKLPRFMVSKITHQMWWGRTTPIQPNQRRNKTRKRAVGWRLGRYCTFVPPLLLLMTPHEKMRLNALP